MGKHFSKQVSDKSTFIIICIVFTVLVIIVAAVFILTSNTPKKAIFHSSENLLTNVIDNTLSDISNSIITVELEGDISNLGNTVHGSIAEENTVSSDLPYYIKVNYTANVVNVYTYDDDGNYIVPVKAMICSCGTATPKSGVFPLKTKFRWIKLFGDVYGQYASQITGNILFHSVPYFSKSPDSLEYLEFDKLGSFASAGCVRLQVSDTLWIFNNCKSGTYVEFYSDSNPGPLGKPSAPKISNNTVCRDWDPTDPDDSNPWHSYSETTEPVMDEPQNEVNNIVSNNVISNNVVSDNNISNNVMSNNILSNNTIPGNVISVNIIEENTVSNNTSNTNNIINNTNTNSSENIENQPVNSNIVSNDNTANILV